MCWECAPRGSSVGQGKLSRGHSCRSSNGSSLARKDLGLPCPRGEREVGPRGRSELGVKAPTRGSTLSPGAPPQRRGISSRGLFVLLNPGTA